MLEKSLISEVKLLGGKLREQEETELLSDRSHVILQKGIQQDGLKQGWMDSEYNKDISELRSRGIR
jgi:hypothetical protein